MPVEDAVCIAVAGSSDHKASPLNS